MNWLIAGVYDMLEKAQVQLQSDTLFFAHSIIHPFLYLYICLDYDPVRQPLVNKRIGSKGTDGKLCYGPQS